MSKLTKAVVRKLMSDMETELQTLFEKYGVAGEVKSAKIDGDGHYATFSLQVGVVQEDGEATTPERMAFLRYAPMHGIDVSWLGREFKLNGDTVVLTGYNTKAKSYPFICQIIGDVAGRFYKLNATQLEKYMNK